MEKPVVEDVSEESAIIDEAFASGGAETSDSAEDNIFAFGENVEVGMKIRKIVQDGIPRKFDTHSKIALVFDFALLCIEWANAFLGRDIVVTRSVYVRAQRWAEILRRLNFRCPQFAKSMKTENKVAVAECIWRAVCAMTCVADQPKWLSDKHFRTFSPMDKSLAKYNLQTSTMPIMQMEQTEIYVLLHTLCARFRELEYSNELWFYVDVIRARVMQFIAYEWRESVLDDDQFTEQPLVNTEVMDMAQLKDLAKRRRKLEAEEERREALREGRIKASADLGGDGAISDDSDESDFSDAEIDEETGRIVFKEGGRGGKDMGEFAIDKSIKRAQEMVQKALESGDEQAKRIAMQTWSEVENQETVAFKELKRYREMYYRMKREMDQPFERRVCNDKYVRDTHATFLEMEEMMQEFRRFPSHVEIKTMDQIVGGFRNGRRRIIPRDRCEGLIEVLTARLHDYVKEADKAQWGEKISPLYFEEHLHIGERQRNDRKQPDADPNAYAVICNARSVQYTTISELAQREFEEIAMDEENTPRFVRELCVLWAFGYAYFQQTRDRFRAKFYKRARDVNLKQPAKYPIFVKAFNRVRVAHHKTLLTFPDVYHAIMYWLMAIMFDRERPGEADGVSIRMIFSEFFPSLTSFAHADFTTTTTKRRASQANKGKQKRARVHESEKTGDE